MRSLAMIIVMLFFDFAVYALSRNLVHCTMIGPFTGTDILIALSTAIMIIVISLCVTMRVLATDIAGYWIATDGEMYELHANSARGFTVMSSGTLEILADGNLQGLRGVRINERRGSVSNDGRRITWPGYGMWSRQGV
jgi:hypothetical protein